MGQHRVDSHGLGRATSQTHDSSSYVGRRRAEVSVSEETAPTPYVGKRRAAVLEVPAPRVEIHAAPAATRHDGFDTQAIAAVLADLEPADQSTSFEGEETAVLPLVQALPGKRRAARRVATTRHPLLRRTPPLPVLVGVAALAVSVGGVVSTTGADLTSAGNQTRVGSVSALNGSDALGHVGKGRGAIVSRDSDRQALAAASDSDLEAQVEEQAEQRNAALGKLAKAAEKHASVLAKNVWQLPVSGYHLTARFGEYGLWSSYHTGLDFAANPGTPIHAIAHGVVSSAGYDGAYGNKTVVTLDDGTEIWFCHQTSIYVSPGDEVNPGDTIGTVGSTGHVTGPHLHLEVRPGGGDPVDPYAALVAHGVTP